MRRPINWFVFSIALVFLFANQLLSGRGGGGEAADRDVAPQPTLVSEMLLDTTLGDFMPKVRSRGRTRTLVATRDCYVTSETSPHGHPKHTSITSFSMQDAEDLVSICYDEMATGVNATTTALYVSQDDFMSGPAAMRTASGQVSGRLWTAGQRDFRMNEYPGMMRATTTEPTSDGGDWQDHRPSALLLEVGTADLRNLKIELFDDWVLEPSASEAMTTGTR
jgi:hypothetical protein